MRRVAVVLVVLPASLGCGGASSLTTPDGGSNASRYASSCPAPTPALQCPGSRDASPCGLNGCGLDSLPSGPLCQAPTQCSALIAPIPGCGRVDGYVCSCVDGQWSCEDCYPGATLCLDAGGD